MRSGVAENILPSITQGNIALLGIHVRFAFSVRTET